MERIFEIMEELKELFKKKNYQYANKENPLGNFYRTGTLCRKLIKGEISNKALVMALMYMAKQIDGVYDMVGENKKNTVDSLIDKLKDIAVYSIIAIALVEEENSNNSKVSLEESLGLNEK